MIRVAAFEFAGGDVFFWALALQMAGTLVRFWRDGPRVRVVWRLAITGSAIVIAASGTPLPLWFYGIGLLTSVLALGAPRLFRVLATLLVCWCVAAAAWEFSYRLPPPLDGQKSYQALAVIGDSVSAGLLGPHDHTWPKQVRERYFHNVVDVSSEGATTFSALKQAESLNLQLGDQSAVVLIEIGGNDYFESVPPSDFAANLERLLTALERPNRQLVLLELPLPPFYNAYGRIQRKLAAQHHVALVSKREFARVVFARGATLDTVHLSETGHSLFADMVWNHVGRLFTLPIGLRSIR